MADSSYTETTIPLVEVLLAPVRGAIGLVDASCGYSRQTAELDRLNGLSDAELDAQGVRRRDIVRHVYRGRRRG